MLVVGNCGPVVLSICPNTPYRVTKDDYSTFSGKGDGEMQFGDDGISLTHEVLLGKVRHRRKKYDDVGIFVEGKLEEMVNNVTSKTAVLEIQITYAVNNP